MTYRVYYNRSIDFPYVWSVDDGDQANEQIVMAIIITPPAYSISHFLNEKPNKESPVAWFAVTGNLQIFDGIAHFN